jgi:hypothetical protein
MLGLNDAHAAYVSYKICTSSERYESNVDFLFAMHFIFIFFLLFFFAAFCTHEPFRYGFSNQYTIDICVMRIAKVLITLHITSFFIEIVEWQLALSGTSISR